MIGRILPVIAVLGWALFFVWVSIQAADEAYQESERHGRRARQHREAYRP